MVEYVILGLVYDVPRQNGMATVDEHCFVGTARVSPTAYNVADWPS